jgi:hypothetical protein
LSYVDGSRFGRTALGRVGITFVGLAIAVGVLASSARAQLAPAIPTRTTAHIETWAFDDGCNGGIGASSRVVRQWVTFAESHCGLSARKARANCRSKGRSYCYVMQYLDANWDYNAEPIPRASAASESWWMHDPSQGTRIYSSTFGGGYLMNQLNPDVRSFFRSYVRRHFNADDGLLMDWQAPSLSQQLYYSTCGCTKTQESKSSVSLRAGHDEMSAALTHRNGSTYIQVDNSLPPNPYLPQGFDMLNNRTGVVGWGAEGLPMDSGVMDPFYSTLLDQIAYVATETNGFVLPMSRGADGAPYQGQSRRVQEATMLLGYSPGHIVDWADLEQGSGRLAVWPEAGIYPTRPIQSMHAPGGRFCLKGAGKVCSTGGHNSIQVAHGVYRREFASCYLRRHLFGACAAVVNTTGHAITVRSSWLRKAPLHHQITFIGGDVQSRGRVDLTGAPFARGSRTLAAHDAMLLAP